MVISDKFFIAEQINAICGARKESVKDFADQVGVPYSTMLNYSQGKSVPKFDFILALHNFGINLDWFVTGVGEMYRANRDVAPLAYQFPNVTKKVGVEESNADTGGRALRLCEFAKWWMANRSPDDHVWLEKQIERNVPEYAEWKKGAGK